MELFRFSKFPKQIAYKIDIIIKTGQTIFTITLTLIKFIIISIFLLLLIDHTNDLWYKYYIFSNGIVKNNIKEE